MRTARKDLSMMRGDTFTIKIQFNGISVNSVDRLTFSVKKKKTDEAYVLQESISNDGVIVYDDYLVIRVAPSHTENVEPGTYKYDIEARIGEDVYTLVDGNLVINMDVTRG